MNKKRTLALVLAMLLAFGAGVGGTLAWLKDSTETVKNTFTTGKVDIDLYEHKWDDENKTSTSEKVKANEYTILPGSTIEKDPTVEVKTGSEDAYVAAVVSVKNAAKLVALLRAGTFDPAEFFGYQSTAGMINGSETGWQVVGYNFANGTLDILFLYTDKAQTAKVVKAGETLTPLFETITIPTALEQADMEELANIEIDVVAYAIQAANIPAANVVAEMKASFDALSNINTTVPNIGG